MKWDPEQYLRRRDERARPFYDLVARIEAAAPRVVVDLGCGPGNLTRSLAQRWPDALVSGVDSSPEMVAVAAEHAIDGRLDFELGDVQTWGPKEPVDVIVTNAVLQWVPDHLELLGRARCSVVARRMVGPPGAGQLRLRLAHGDRGASCLAAMERTASVTARCGRSPSRRPTSTSTGWRAWVAPSMSGRPRTCTCSTGDDAVLEWVRGTALRPVLSALSPEEAAEFEDELRVRLREAYPPRSYGTVLPFRRIFAVAQRP